MSASRRHRFKDASIRKLVWFHRWLGIATCLIFALWFASGAVLLFEPFPSLPRQDQMAIERPIDVEAVRLTPAEAIAASGGAAEALRLVQRGDAPAYVVSTATGAVAVDARTGRRAAPLGSLDAERVARRLSATATPVSFDYDQWVVHNRFDPLRPFFRLDREDDAGTQLYLSAATGELVQRTTRSERGWNWVGAVLHWAYFTPLRSSFTAWDRTVWWLSFVALLVAVAGTVLGIVRTVAARRQRKPAWSAFRLRWLRWHHLLGLVAGAFVLTWTLSGWLSMDHGRLFSRGTLPSDKAAAYQAGTLADGLREVQPARLRASHAREIDFAVVAGRPVIGIWGEATGPRIVDGSGQALTMATVDSLAREGAARAWSGTPPSSANPVSATRIYALAEGWPASARVIEGDGSTRPDIVFDGATGRVLTVNDGSRKAYAWIYYALHTFNFPGLADRPRLRQAIVVPLMALGFVFSITGAAIGWQRLRKSVRPIAEHAWR